jgi:hypothetical protein
MITLTTDFGDSHYVGAVKGAILSVHPEARIVDVTHGVRRQDVRAGAFALMAAVPYFPPGAVHVAVVDPGVGTPRRPLLVETLRGHLVGPDNGLLMPAARRLGLLTVRELTNKALWRGQVSTTFHGRDIFGPVAAHLDKGLAPSEAGPALRGQPQPLDFGEGRAEQGMLVGELVLVDRFGNCVTNIPGPVAHTMLEEGEEVQVEWPGGALIVPFRRAYAEAKPGEPLLIVDSAGYLEVAVSQGSFAELSGLDIGMQVRVRPS